MWKCKYKTIMNQTAGDGGVLWLPDPGMILMTPLGMPALAASSANFSAVRGVTWMDLHKEIYLYLLCVCLWIVSETDYIISKSPICQPANSWPPGIMTQITWQRERMPLSLRPQTILFPWVQPQMALVSLFNVSCYATQKPQGLTSLGNICLSVLYLCRF